ncbi:MAG: DUF1501 domain-containing protein [Chloroflexi bacterium]|nr:DUF1501 domain-containing protein [Chloroflexota bacterium]
MPFTRRDFLKRGALFVGLGLTAPAWITETVEAVRLNSQARAGGPNRKLVVVQLGGGNDGLNTVVPYAADRYYEARPTLAVARDQVLPVTDQIGLHPSLTGIKRRLDSNQMTIVQGVGYPNPNRSHFRSMEIWETAQPAKAERTGWIGRYLDANCCGTAAPRPGQPAALSITNGDLPQTLWTDHVLVPSLGSLAAFQFQTTDGESPDERANHLETFRKIYERANPRVYDEFVRGIGRDALATSQRLQRIASTYQPAVDYPDTGFGNNLQTIAQLIDADLGTRIFYAALGGFDTHATQANAHAQLLRVLAEGLAAFLDDLEAKGKLGDVLVLCFSEFGRRVAQNGSGGTDHGTAEPIFLLGGNLGGGIVGAHPSLGDLTNGDLKYAIDFRSVYASVLQEWLETPSQVLLGAQFSTLGLVRGTRAAASPTQPAPEHGPSDGVTPMSMADDYPNKIHLPAIMAQRR